MGILIGLMSFMYEEDQGAIGSLLASWEDRKKYAQASEYFNAQNEIYVELFHQVEDEEQAEQLRILRNQWNVNNVSGSGDDDEKPACRYCLVDSGELVNPCA